jgi:hypothetical protein
VANPTTNYGFVLSTASDLVTDLPADFDVALQGVDTRLKALQPGTTSGDLAYSSATANTNVRLAIGSTSQVLTVSGGVPAWATPAASAANYAIINSGGTALTGAGTITVSGISGKESLMILVDGASSASANSNFQLRFNTDTGSNYTNVRTEFVGTSPNATNGAKNVDVTVIPIAVQGNAVADTVTILIQVEGTNSAGLKVGSSSSTGNNVAGANGMLGQFYYKGTSAISSVSLISNTGNFDAGTIYVYGA